MRRFHSYGPVDCERHYCILRKDLVEKCVTTIIDHPESGGHYFTVWAPRQTGKTWLIEQSLEKISKQYEDRFITGCLSMQGFEFNNDDPIDEFLIEIPAMIEQEFGLKINALNRWSDFKYLFSKNKGIFDRPLILFIDEFDKLPNHFIDAIVSTLRDLYQKRKNYMLHGIGLIGVRAVLGVDSIKGSPFNIQRSMHIPNLTYEETLDMFNQYQEESGQQVEKQVIQKLYEVTNGQPGLVSWFGELLTEKYNEPSMKIDINLWEHVYSCSRSIEHNNTVQNIIAKAKNEYKSYVLDLFSNANVRFSFDVQWCNYMYMHGLICYEEVLEKNELYHICRFSSPFIQARLYKALTDEIKAFHNRSVLALDPLDFLEDVFDGLSLNIPALLIRYNGYLKRLKDKNINPWNNQPRRKSDLHLTEAVGHFHLYHWLQMALGTRCSISPEFPTGNGKVDLHLECDNKKGLIEVKSFVNAYETKKAMAQAVKYAAKTDYKAVTIAIFAPFDDENLLKQMSVNENIDGVLVSVVVIGQA
ncbi:hypothetical protein MHK_002352 [Candidatus Magnetomorum sp. HK-1]|nr:hypothetical protein MHK_002352 [Candidatus Magnetomorum sp. HK-1]